MAQHLFTQEEVEAMIEKMRKKEIEMMEKDKQLKEVEEKLAESERAREQEKQQKKSERSEKVLETVQQEMNAIILSVKNFRKQMTRKTFDAQYTKLRENRTEQWLHARKLWKRLKAGALPLSSSARPASSSQR